MKKLVFAAIAAAFVFVSVNNAVANNKIDNATIAPVDTVAPADSTVTPEQPTEQPAEQDTTQQAPVQPMAIAE